MGSRAVFLDRDGVLNALAERPDGTYGAPLSPDEVRILPGVAEALQRLLEADRLVFVVSNQPDVAHGRMSLAGWYATHAAVRDALPKLTSWSYCHHHPDAGGQFGRVCGCRKPLPGMLLDLARSFRVDMGESWMVGDRGIDILAGKAAGVGGTILVGDDSLIPDLSAAVEMILA